MATEVDDVPELDEQDMIPDDGGDAHEPVEGEGTPGEAPDDDGEEYVTFGDDTPEPVADEKPLIKHLRTQLRERERELSQYRRAPDDQPIVVGEKPTLASCDYDEERLDRERDEWEERKRQADAQKKRQEDAKRQQDDAWGKVTERYASRKAALPYRDKNEAEAVVFDALSPVSQAVIAKVATDPALFIYAAGKNAARLSELAKIDDPLVLAATVARMEATLKTQKRSVAPDPDTPVRGKVIAQGADKKLQELERKAAASGDRTELIKYKAEQARLKK